MIVHKKKPIALILAHAIGVGAFVAIPGVALAQQSGDQKVERVTVTGSNIKRTDAETASPVQILTREDIEKTGKQSIQEVLRTITADGQGSLPTSFSNGFASGSAAVSLRGLGVNSTLVLVNGRRMTTYGLADDGTRNFVDLNSLPLEAVDRIEVLKDGASAIYGSDAIGGVVNVILRQNYTGASAGASYGQASRGDGATTRAFGTFGKGNIDTDNYNVFFSFEASQQKNIWSTDRGFIGQSDLSSRGFYNTTNGQPRPWFGANITANSPYGVTRGTDGLGTRANLLPCPGNVGSNGYCQYNSLQEQEVQPAIDRLNLFAKGTLKFSSSLTAYIELGLFTTKTKANGTLGANNDGGVYNPGGADPLIVHNFMVLPAGHPDNPTPGTANSLYIRPMNGGRDEQTDNQVFRLVQGLQGTAWGWDFDVGLSYITNRLKDQRTGYINWQAMQDALTAGTYRISPTVATAPSVLAAISPTLEITPTNTVKSIDAKVTRPLMDLAGGSLGVALGAEVRWEDANTPAVPGTESGAIVGLGYSAFRANRMVSALYGEFTAPVTKWLELNAAARFDHYSDVGDSTTPKVGFKLTPIDWLAVRGNYAEAFRAPGPAESGGSSFGFTSVGILSQGNPNIKPETAKTYTLGLIVDPFVGTSATLDYWKVDRKNEIVQVDPATVLAGMPTTGTPLSHISGAEPNSFIYYDVDGKLSTVTGFYRNAAATKTDGYDFNLRHKMKLGEGWGKLTVDFNWTHVNKFQRTDANGNVLDYAGTQGPIVLSSGAGTPKDKATLSLTWDQHPWTLTGSINYVGPLKLVDHKGEQAVQNIDPDTGLPDGTISDNTNGLMYTDNGKLDCAAFDTNGNPYNNCRLPSFTTFDLFGKWTPAKNLDINFSIQNLFDRKAPFDPYLVLTYGINYNQTWHQSGAVGRFFTLGAKYSF
jgi:iron complex outermembrane receptor protein